MPTGSRPSLPGSIVFAVVLLLLRGGPAPAFTPARPEQPPELRELERNSHLNRGDPGWMRRMAARRLRLEQAAHPGTALQALPVDRFHLPVLLLSFTDQAEKYPASSLRIIYFGGNTDGNLTEYFREVSGGRFELTGEVEGWYRSDNPKDYYLKQLTDEEFPRNYGGLVLEALAKADPAVDFSRYDNDGPDGASNSGDDDGYADAVMVVYAGVPTHDVAAGLQGTLDEREFTTGDPAAGGGKIKVNAFLLVPELLGSGANTYMSIGIACHEFCHVLGLPDLYDYTMRSYGLGDWCLMARGANNDRGRHPAHLSAWCKLRLGWAAPVELREDGWVSLDPAEGSSQCYRLWEDGYGLSRYFLLENRQQTGFDSALPGQGLLIYHVDEQRCLGADGYLGFDDYHLYNNDFQHKLVDLEEADGREDLDRRDGNPGDAGDPFPGASGGTAFDDFSSPGSRDYQGNLSEVAVRGIDGFGGRINARVTVRKPLGYALVYDRQGITGAGRLEGGLLAPQWCGVRFEAAEAGVLEALDLGLLTPSGQLVIEVYRGLDGNLKPQGLLHRVSNDSPLRAGWHTIELNNPELRLEQGQEFFVVWTDPAGFCYETGSPDSGRSFRSTDGGRNYLRLPEGGNLNLRARIRTAAWDGRTVFCDFDGNGIQDNQDMLALLRAIRADRLDLRADFNRDGRCDIRDALWMLLARLQGACPDR